MTMPGYAKQRWHTKVATRKTAIKAEDSGKADRIMGRLLEKIEIAGVIS